MTSANNSKTDSKLVDRQAEAEQYLKTHKINELFANITSYLVFNKPGINQIHRSFFFYHCCNQLNREPERLDH